MISHLNNLNLQTKVLTEQAFLFSSFKVSAMSITMIVVPDIGSTLNTVDIFIAESRAFLYLSNMAWL